MSHPSSTGRERGVDRLRDLPATTWIGIGCTALLALAGLVSGGVWSMLLIVALIVVVTATYGLIFRRRTWLRLPRRPAAGALCAGVALAVLLGSSAAYGAAHPAPEHLGVPDRVETSSTITPTPSPTPIVTTKVITETAAIPFPSTTVESSTAAAGTSSVTTAGVDGVDTKTYLVSYSDGVETGRALQSDVVTTPPITQVTTIGTYVAPPQGPTCTNGTYVNSAGNRVCSPESSPTAPSGATAKCADGTYSFSQSRRGTCSSHGGVAEWL